MKSTLALALSATALLTSGCMHTSSSEPRAEPAAATPTASQAETRKPSDQPARDMGAKTVAPECSGSDHTSPGDACAPPANGPGSKSGELTAPPPHASRSDRRPPPKRTAAAE